MAGAYIAGLEARRRSGERLDRLASVVCLELAPVDDLFDPILEDMALRADALSAIALKFIGKVAIANACAIYLLHQEIFGSDRFQGLAAFGANPQRLVWSNVDTACASHNPMKYLTALPVTGTVSLLPREIIAGNTIRELEYSRQNHCLRTTANTIERLQQELQLNPTALIRKLEHDGLRMRRNRYQRLLDSLGQTVNELLTPPTAYKTA